ncbi:MAG: hypothetical protein AMJ79_10485 [Phycisphaerae bacterium SM23_30]|nr:MAG: hypothetical protein AMJ79_10485 [Phycisphaerae bacterium SM23_30]
MSFFTSGLFWFLEGVCFCLAGAALKHYLEDRGIPMRWWKWMLFAGWVILLGFTIAFITTSAGENETVAALKGGIILVPISIITGAVIWRLLKAGRRPVISQASDQD